MAIPSFIPGNHNLITETLYKPQEDYAFVNEYKAEPLQPNPDYIRGRDGPFIQAYYQHYEADVPYKNAVFTPQLKPANLSKRPCNPLVAYPYGMPQKVEYEKCSKCKGNKKCNRRRKTKSQSVKNTNGDAVDNLFTSKLKSENGAYELPENINDDLDNMHCIHVHNDGHEGGTFQNASYYSNAISCSNNLKEEICDCHMGINEKSDDNDINNNSRSNFTNVGSKRASFRSYNGDKINEETEEYLSPELKNCAHLSIENDKYSSSYQQLFMDSNDIHKDVNINVHNDMGCCKKEAIKGDDQYCVKLNDEIISKHSALVNIKTDTVKQEVTDERDKDDVIFNQLTDVINENTEGSQQNVNNNDDEMGSSNLTKSQEQRTDDDANVLKKKDSKEEIKNQELSNGVIQNPKRIKRVYICDGVKTLSYHVDRESNNSKDMTKCIIKKKKNITTEASNDTYKGKEEGKKQIKPNTLLTPPPKRTKKPTQPRVCHVEVMMQKKEKENIQSKKKGNGPNNFKSSATNVEEIFPSVTSKTFSKQRIVNFPASDNKKLKNKIKEQILNTSFNNEKYPREEGSLELTTNEEIFPSETMKAPLKKKIALRKTISVNIKSLQNNNATPLLKKTSNTSEFLKKNTKKKLLKKSNDDSLQKIIHNKSSSLDKEKIKFRSKKFLSRSTTVFYGNEKPVPFKTTEVKRYSESIPPKSTKVESLILNENDSNIKKKKIKDATKNKKDVTTKMNKGSKQLKSDNITKKLKSKKKELYDNILSLTKNIKKSQTDDSMNEKKGDIKQNLQNSPRKKENILKKNVDNADVFEEFYTKKSRSVKGKMLSTKNEEENQNADGGDIIKTLSLKNKMKTLKGIKQNSKEVKAKEEKKRKISTKKSSKKELSKQK